MSITQSFTQVSMASQPHTKEIHGYVSVDLSISGRHYTNVKLHVLDNLCTDVILGLDFQKQHKCVRFNFGGEKPAMDVCSLEMSNVKSPELFSNLTPDVKPIATKSRKYNVHDRHFIQQEVQKLLSDGIIEKSNSPWRAQVVVSKDENHKKRLVVDYSQTINKYTNLDAYPLPNMNDFINHIACYKVFSSIDLKSAYHQVPLDCADRMYTAFEWDGALYQFTRMPFGVTNGPSCFQRIVNDFIKDNNIEDTFAYMDNIYVCGVNQEEHDQNLKQFLDEAASNNWTFNKPKCVFSTERLEVLGAVVENGSIRPDPERLRPLRELPLPHNCKSLKRVVGLFSHYSKWIPKFSDKVAPLIGQKQFPLSDAAKEAFEQLKRDIENSVVQCIDETKPFELECDASDFALAAVLNQGGRPVALFSRTLHGSTRRKRGLCNYRVSAQLEAFSYRT